MITKNKGKAKTKITLTLESLDFIHLIANMIGAKSYEATVSFIIFGHFPVFY